MQENKLTTNDLQAIADLLDKQTAVLATKEELKKGLTGLDVSLKTYMHEGFESVMDGMDDLATKSDVRDRVDKLEKDVKQLKLNRSAN